jgi:hypothetical protein
MKGLEGDASNTLTHHDSKMYRLRYEGVNRQIAPAIGG